MLLFVLYFDKKNAILVSIRGFFLEIINELYQPQPFERLCFW